MNRPPISLLVLLACWLLPFALPAQDIDRRGPAVSPFRGMRQVENGIEVQVLDDTWHALESVAGVDTATLLREAKRLCGRSAWKRITEDLPALLDAMGTKVGDAVDVEVRDLATKERRKLAAVAMTNANRQRVKAANDGRAAGAAAAAAATGSLTLAAARADLQQLRTLLDTAFAYRELRPVDLDALLRDADAALAAAGEPVAPDVLARAVDRVLRAFGDGHSRVDVPPRARPEFLPFLVQHADGGLVAFQADRSALVDAVNPFVAAIDGVDVAKWLDAARALGTQGSAQMQAREAERGLRDLGELRAAQGLPSQGRVTVTLRGTNSTRDLVLDVAPRRPVYGTWPRTSTRRLDDDLGYLRIDEMSDDAAFLDGLDATMKSFRDTKGLVIDVRGNGGGTRDALRRLAPYLMPKNSPPLVGNVAAVLLDGGAPAAPDALADRGLYPLEWDGWKGSQRAAIAAFVRGFKPSWKPPAGKFSPWCFLVLDRNDNPKALMTPYERKVVVLIDRGCFSATDVFAAALATLPSVTLVGEATSGGSGRAKPHRLANSGLRLQLSTMASFRPDGVLFEGNGVTPDVEVAAQARDLIGATDSVLAKAIELLRASAPRGK
jgi:hypothetical protein